MFGLNECAKTVSILEAILLGSEGACISLDPVSLIGGVVAFIGCVVLLRLIAMTGLRRVFPGLRRNRDAQEATIPSEDAALQRMPYESSIRFDPPVVVTSVTANHLYAFLYISHVGCRTP